MKYRNLHVSWYIVFLLGIIIFASLLRGVELINKNYLFLFDHGIYYQDISGMLETKTPRLTGTYSPIPGVFQGPYFYYSLFPFFFLLQGDPYSGVIYSFIIGITSILISWFLVLKYYDKTTAILIAFIFTVSPSAISASRMLWPPYTLYFIMPFYIIYFAELARGKSSLIPLVLFISGIATLFELPVGLFLYIPVGILIFKSFRSLLKKKIIIPSIFALVIPYIPLIIFNFRHDNISIHGLLQLINGTYKVGSSYKTWELSFGGHIVSFQNVFASTFFTSVSFNIFIVLVIIIGLLLIIKQCIYSQSEKTIISILIFLPIIGFILLIPLNTVIWGWYLIPYHIVFIFLSGFLLKGMLGNNKLKILAIIFILLLFVNSIKQVIFQYSTEIYDSGGSAKIKAKIEAIDTIYQDSKGKKFNVLVFMPPVYTYPYDYLFKWYGGKQYGYIPTNKQEGLYYLLIEPDSSKPWSYNGWKETVLHITKNPEWVKELESGIVIEKYSQN